MTKYKKGSAWKRANWDKWSFWRKVRHVIAVILSLISVIIMSLLGGYFILFFFGLHGFILKIRDTILLEIMRWIFG
jgi:hypothetical protein